MIPGTTSKLSTSIMPSAATIRPKTDVVLLTTNTSISRIIPSFGGFSGFVILVALNGDITLLSGGNNNILSGGTLVQDKATMMIFVINHPNYLNGIWIPQA